MDAERRMGLAGIPRCAAAIDRPSSLEGDAALGARRGDVLLSLLVLPLYIPVLIFGVSAVDAGLGGFPFKSHLLALGGLLLATLALCPWVSASALRQALRS